MAGRFAGKVAVAAWLTEQVVVDGGVTLTRAG